MPKRIVDGDALWTSNKIQGLKPEYQAEYAYLIPLALANGTFECDARLIWRAAYSYGRSHITPEIVEDMLADFERNKMLFRWWEGGKEYGFWVGIKTGSRLPGPSRNSHEKRGPEVPDEALEEFLTSQRNVVVSQRKVMDSINFRPVTNGQPTESYGTLCLGLGLSLGKGKGKGGSAEPAGPADAGACFLSPSQSKGTEQDPPPEAASILMEVVPVPTEIIPADQDLVPAEDDPSAGLRIHLHPLRITNKDFDPLDFAFSRDEEFGGLSPRELQRTIWYHWRIVPADKRYWSDPAKGRITTIARLQTKARTMAEQVPADFRMPGSVYQPIHIHDPACQKCDGRGYTNVPDPFYEKMGLGFSFEVSRSCECEYLHPAPWRFEHEPVLM